MKQRHVSMSIRDCTRDDWILIDHGYLDRLAERKLTADIYPEKCVMSNQSSYAAIQELWEELVSHILVKFPTIFREKNRQFRNIATGQIWDLDEVSQDTTKQLHMLSQNVEEDFFFMCPDGENNFRLQGYIACFPNGFDSSLRIGLSVAEIHAPVPSYKERLQKGTDRFFGRMKCGDIVERFNVCVSLISFSFSFEY